jgi:hypothetical protein
MLFTDRSLWTMAHGIVLGGAALMALAAALFGLYALRASARSDASASNASRAVAGLAVFTAVVLWLAVLSGTYIVFPPYRVTPPAGTTDLAAYPRALVLSNPGTAWLHAFAMETKEHVPWIAAMLATAVAFVTVRYRTMLLHEASLRNIAMSFLAISCVLVAFVSLMGIFVNKVAPLQ